MLKIQIARWKALSWSCTNASRNSIQTADVLRCKIKIIIFKMRSRWKYFGNQIQPSIFAQNRQNQRSKWRDQKDVKNFCRLSTRISWRSKMGIWPRGKNFQHSWFQEIQTCISIAHHDFPSTGAWVSIIIN